MGTVLEATVCVESGEGEAAAPRVAARLRDVFATARRLDAELTTWAPDGPLIRLNRSAGGAALATPPDLRRVLAASVHWSGVSGGAFDVSVGPLVRLWRAAGESGREPSSAELRAALALVGSDRIEIAPDGTVRLDRAGMSLDLGGIGKGFALDRIAESLRARGVSRAFLDFGRSSLLALGSPARSDANAGGAADSARRPADGSARDREHLVAAGEHDVGEHDVGNRDLDGERDGDGWRVLVRRPDGPPLGIVTLRDRAASVSATFGASVEIAGRRYGHVVDPRTGRPVERDALALVVAPDATGAEALSKALLVLGPERGLALLATLPGVEGLLVDASGRKARTPGFDRAVGFEPLREAR